MKINETINENSKFANKCMVGLFVLLEAFQGVIDI